MLIYPNAEWVHGQRKFGNPWFNVTNAVQTGFVAVREGCRFERVLFYGRLF